MNEKEPILRSLAMIEEKIQEKLTVEMLAEDIHFSKYHFQRIFREAVGDTVMRYVTRRKLFLAAKELAQTTDSVLEIAFRYGYDSHEGFTRSFKAYMGVTPTEYRKYHSAISFPERKKEACAMMDSTNTEEMIRELNSLIVQAKETAADTKRYSWSENETATVYAQVLHFAANRAEKMAEELTKITERVTMATQHSDELSARFLIVKGVEDAAFEASVTAFQVGLMIARALPEYRVKFQPLCARYNDLAQNARMKSAKIVDFLHELSDLIFQDIRKNVALKIGDAVKAGEAAAKKLSDPALPYGYIADGVRTIAKKLDALAPEDVTIYFLEDAAFRLETVLFAADMDILRAPQHRLLFDGISGFKSKLEDAVAFFQSLSEDRAMIFSEAENDSEKERAERKRYHDLAMQEGVLLFYLKGEIQKLGDVHLDAGQKVALDAVCDQIDRAVKLSHDLTTEQEKNQIATLLRGAYDELMKAAEGLGLYGGAIQYLAEEVKKPLKYLA